MSLNYDYLFKLLLIGDSGAGKSSILLRLSEGVFHDRFLSTIGIDFKVRTLNLDDKVVKVQIWDTAGQERFRTITNAYYRGAHGILLIYNIDDRQSFADIENWRHQINKYANEKVVKILIGNKCDMDGQRQVGYDEAKAYADDMGFQFFETSAKTAENIEEALFGIVGEIKKKLESEDNNPNGEAENKKVNMERKEESDAKRCCQ